MSLVTNGGFDAGGGSLTGWTVTPSLSVIATTAQHDPVSPPASAEFQVNGGTITQSIATVSGQPYTLNFSAFTTGLSTDTITYSTDGGTTTHTANIGGVDTWENFSDNFTAGASTTILFRRGLNQIFLDNVSVVCFSGESLIRCRNKLTGEISDIKAKYVLSSIHEVYSVNTGKFIPIIYNIKMGSTKSYYLIEKDSIAENQPTQDFYITDGHPIVIDGQEIIASKLPYAKLVEVEPELVYSICTELREPITISGLDVMTWSQEDWLEYVAKYSPKWINNRI